MLARRSPGATVWAVDVNERALGLCARNAAAAGLSNVRCVTPEDPGVPARLAGIWSNPPVRIGKPALHELLSAWLVRLAPGGQAYLVAGVTQRTLGSPAAAAFRAHSSSARSLTSTAQTVAPGDRLASTQATGP